MSERKKNEERIETKCGKKQHRKQRVLIFIFGYV